jgi:cobalamin synthase
MNEMASREMTLDEWVNTLPMTHRVHHDLDELRRTERAYHSMKYYPIIGITLIIIANIILWYTACIK